jgi:hypothetical protein
VGWGSRALQVFLFSFSAFAAKQRRDTNSMLNWTERIIRMRKEMPEVGCGLFDILDVGSDAVLGGRYDWRNNSELFLHNFAHVAISGKVTSAFRRMVPEIQLRWPAEAFAAIK